MITDKNDICNRILEYLSGKQMAEWTPEENIEKDLADEVHYFHIRQAMPQLKVADCVEFSKHGSSYKISKAGQKFLNDGGFKTQPII